MEWVDGKVDKVVTIRSPEIIPELQIRGGI